MSISFLTKSKNSLHVYSINLSSKVEVPFKYCEIHNSYVISIELPEYRREDIKLIVDHKTLSVYANKKEKVDNNDQNFSNKLSNNSLYQCFYFPGSLDVNKSKAEFKNGMLTIFLPKISNSKIEIKIS